MVVVGDQSHRFAIVVMVISGGSGSDNDYHVGRRQAMD